MGGGQFDIDLTIMMDWLDPSIVGKEAYADVDRDHFSPYVTIDNCAEPDLRPKPGWDSSASRIMQCEEDKLGKVVQPIPGHVKRTLRFKTKILIEDIDLKYYPFDSQRLAIKLKGDRIKLSSQTLCGDDVENPRARFESGKNKNLGNEGILACEHV